MKSAPLAFTLRLFACVSLPLVSSAADRADELGTIQFAVTGTPEARDQVVRGVKLVHHMMYLEADRAFAAASADDPRCALAYWGRAMALVHPLWPDAPTSAELQRGAGYIRQGLSCPPATPRERAYLEALDRYFGRHDASDHPAGLRQLDEAWSAVADEYPDDLDALAFSALYRLAPARFVTKDQSYRLQLDAAARLQRVLARLPDHPGALHYKIHAYDSPLLAGRALEICDTYAGIAPDVPHALHMPTHIFTRRGQWDKSIEFNLRSADAARKLGEADGALNGHYPHALDYLVYAYLQRGQYREADAVRRRILALTGPYAPAQATQMAFAFAAIPARVALERQAWTEAAALTMQAPASFPWGQAYPHCESIVRFARGLGAARSGDRDAARQELHELEVLQRRLGASNRVSYWSSQAETQLLAIRAWLQFDEQNPDEAIALLRRAVALEMSTDKEAVTPGEVVPAGDLLGDLLLAAGRNVDALAAFEAVLAASPHRLNTLYGAGFAAERAGDLRKAQEYYQQLATVAAESDGGVPRVEHARAFLQRQALASR